MSEPAVATRQLEYAPRRTFLRRRWKRLTLVGLLALVGVAGVAFRANIAAGYARYGYLHAQRRCLDFAPPPDRIAFDETASASGLLANPEYVAAFRTFADDPPTAFWNPQPFKSYWPTVRFPNYAGSASALLFLHERTTPAGQRRLCCVLAWLDVNLTTHHQYLTIGLYVVRPATWGGEPNVLDGAVVHIDALFGPLDQNHPDALKLHKPLRIFAGQTDPDDATHFTIDYERGGERGTLDGYLRDPAVSPDGSPLPVMELVSRKGPKL